MTLDIPAPIPTPHGWGVEISCGALTLRQTEPFGVELAGEPAETRSIGYQRIEKNDDGFTGYARLAIAAECELTVVDDWRAGASGAELSRAVRVHGTADAAFSTAIMVGVDRPERWSGVEPFSPGVAYGDSERVAERSLAGLPARLSGVRTILIREDRMAAPLFALRYPSGDWFGVLHPEPQGDTTRDDGVAEDGGETLVSDRFRFASLGGRERDEQLEAGLCFPGTEGEYTYSSGGLPLKQLPRWRRRYHPALDGTDQHYLVEFRGGSAATTPDFYRDAWRWAWSRFEPRVATADVARVVRDSAAVLAGQVRTTAGKTGIALEADAVNPVRSDEDSSAVMGFVGANTDAGYLLIRVADSGTTAEKPYRRLGEDILDTFAALQVDPPEGEGFDTATGEPTTYRRYLDRPAVYSRSLAEGALAMLDAVAWERRRGRDRANWLAWATRVGDWLRTVQHDDGGIPRAWEAETGRPLDGSTSASYVVVPLLTALFAATGDPDYREAAERAALFVWNTVGITGSYAGATLDNPDVVDKEAAVLAAEGFLALFHATGERNWLDRAESAAAIAETWIYIWNVPMPADADDSALHWKKNVPTIGHQLIASGVSMTDGFLAVNSALFARLFEDTGNAHWLEVARLVLHGSTSMLASRERPFDLRGPGWQQEHWSFAPRRGFGLNRRWLPWVPVAHVRGIHRVEDLGPALAALVLTDDGERPAGADSD